MAIKVKYLTEDEIEKDAKLLLAEYEDTIGEPINLPVPVDDITTYHLALRLGFDDLHKTLNRPMLRSQPDRAFFGLPPKQQTWLGRANLPRQFLDNCPAVSVLRLYREGYILPGTTSIVLSINGGEPVSVAITRQVLPQYTAWAPGIPAFSCPTCGRNVRNLYVRNSQFGCRHCFRLAYSSRHLRR